MKNTKVILGVIIGLILLSSIIAFNISSKDKIEVNSFEECAAAGYPIMESYPRQCRTRDGKNFVESLSLDEYFFQEMINTANEKLGVMPIEGYSPDMYLGVYPGLVKEDFNNVKAYGGVWRVVGNELVFERNVPQNEITSADGTVNQEGMKTLMATLSKRLNIDVDSKEEVDILIDRIEE